MMKKHTLLRYGFWSLLALGSISCVNQPVAPEEPAVEIKVKSSQLDFPATGGNGYITLDTEEAITAVSDRDWCIPEVSGQTVKLTVGAYDELESRNTNLRLTVGESTLRVTVRQMGILVKMPPCDTTYRLGDGRYTILLPASSDGGMEVSGESWISGTYESGALILTVEPNDSGHIREGYARFQAGIIRDSIRIIQGALKDVLKEYILTGIDNSGTTQTERIVLSEAEGGGLSLSFPDRDWTAAATFDPATLSMQIGNSQYIGASKIGSSNYHVFLHQYNTAQQIFNSASGGSLAARFNYDDATGKTTATFYDNGSWGVYSSDGIIFVGYSRRDASGAPAGLKKYPLILGKVTMNSL